MSSSIERKLTTILAADAEGYSRVMADDEVRAVAALQAARQVFFASIERHHGRVANTAGDGLIADFPSVVEAVQCAIEVQRELAAPGQDGMRFRIGIHLGDVIVDGADLLGEGVNLAARLQSMAEPGGILISQQVYDHVHAKLSAGFEFIGGKRPKNYSRDVAVYRVSDRVWPPRQEPEPPPGPPPDAARQAPLRGAEDLRARVLRHASVLGIVWVGLLAINLATGTPLWVQWPAIAFAAAIGMEAAQLCTAGRTGRAVWRGGVVAGTLVAINAATWTGTPWALWPIGALVAFGLIRHVSMRSS